MPLNLSSLETFSPGSGLDLSSLDSSSPDSNDTTNKDKSSIPTSPTTLDLSSLEQVPDVQAQLEKPTEEIKSKFGVRTDPILKTPKFHNGIDLKFPLNTPVKSLGKGLVIDVGNTGKKDYGKYVTVDYGGGLQLTYGHLNGQKVEKGDLVSSDAILGISGSTGRSTGPHLHIKAMLNGQPVDPTKYFSSTNAIINGVSSDENVVSNIPKLDLNSLADSPSQKVSQISISGADIIHHLGFDPTKIDELNPSLKSHIISTINKAVEEDKIKRENGQTEFPVDFNYQNQMRKKVGLPQMNSIMQQFKSLPQNDIAKEAISFGNYKDIPIIYNIASTVAPETQATHRNNLIENYKETITANLNKAPASYRSGNQIVSMDYFLPNMSQEEINKAAEKAADQQLAAEEQQHLDAISRTAKFTKDIITTSGGLLNQSFPGIKTQDIARGFADFVGSTTKNIGDWSAVLYPTEATEMLQDFGRKVQAGAAIQREENPTNGSFFSNIQRGLGEGVGRSPELIKLYAGAELLGPELAGLNLPLQGAISNVSEGAQGMAKGALGGIVYHYGGGFTAPYLGRVGNSLLWISAPAAEAHLIGGQDLATAIGSNIPMGLFVGISGGERAKVIDGNIIRSANLTDIPKIQSGEITFAPPSYRVGFEKGKIIEELARRFNSVPLDINVPKIGFTIPVPTAEANLRLLDLKRDLAEGNYKEQSDSPEQIAVKEQKIQDSIAVLEKGIPDDVKKFYSENETAIRNGINTEIARKDELEKQPIFKDGKLREDVGVNNTWGTSSTKAEEILKNFTKISVNNNKLAANLGIPYAGIMANKVADLSYLTAFFIEDYYHRGIEPTISLVRNRLSESLGDFSKHLKDETLKEAFDKGLDYFKSNTADPFFSRMKQDAAEKLPNRFTAEQAQNILKQHVDEFNWTTGLDEFFKENDGKKISKQQLLDAIQKGQVRVEISVAEEKWLKLDDDPIFQKLQEEHYAILRDVYDSERNKTRTEEEFKELNDYQRTIEYKLQDRERAIRRINETTQPKYSLKAYSGEKLELPGAVNSKEVKLISVQDAGIPFNITHIIFDPATSEIRGLARSQSEADMIVRGHLQLNLDFLSRKSFFKKYESAHWDEPNVVAHYRSNDRTTTDNIPISFSEEFQSDWNHDIRERGAKLNQEERIELDKLENKFHNLSQEELQRHDILQARVRGIEPNPFMQHTWKELVFKRFLRDAVIAKDENGNYKYEGIGWTTARQQQERYGRVLEGKNFSWQKNSDETYTFGFGNTHDLTNEDNFNHPHELQNISLERFAELTTKEAAEEVRSQEKNQQFQYRVEASDSRRFPSTHGIYDTIDKANTRIDELGSAIRKEAKIVKEPKTNPSGKFSLKEAVELRSGIGKYSDYDVAMVNYARKIGKRFGAKYDQKTIETTPDRPDLNSDESNIDEALGLIPQRYKTENIHFLEITPSMRESLSKEGFPLYGLGGSEKLKSQDLGTRNSIVSAEAFDQHRNDLVKSMQEAFVSLENRAAELQDKITRAKLVLEIQPNNTDYKQIVEDSTNELEKIRAAYNPYSAENGTVFNSGLSPDAFIDQTKLLYKGIREFSNFSKQLVTRFGESISPFIQDLWLHIKHGWELANAPSEIDIANAKAGKSTTFSMRLIPFDLGRFDPRNTKIPAEKDYLSDASKHQSELDKRFLMRGIGHAQWDSNFAETYDSMNKGRRLVNYLKNNILEGAKAGNKFLYNSDNTNVGEVIHQAIEQFKTFTYAELRNGSIISKRPALTDKEANAYLAHRSIQDQTLNIKQNEILYQYQKRVNNLNDQLAAATLGSTTYTDLFNQVNYLKNRMKDVGIYYDKLKTSGYTSLQRTGPIAAFIEDSNGDKLYDQFEDRFKAANWIKENIINGAKVNTQSIYDIRNLNDFTSLTKAISPANFEDLVIASGLNSTDPAIEKLRDQIYAQFASTGYKLKRDFVKGYERTWTRAVQATLNQTQKYSSSFYANVVGDDALISLAKSGVMKSDPNLYTLAKGYIEDEIYSPESTKVTRTLARARRLTSFIQLGWQFNRFIQHAIGKPMSNGLSYFARVDDPNNSGNKLSKLEPEQYFARGVKLGYEGVANWLATSSTTGGIVSETRAKIGQKLDKTNPTKLQKEFFDIYSRLNQEETTQPRFVQSLLMMDTEVLGENLLKTNLQKFFSLKQQEHWAGVFLRAGERVSRSQTAATAFLVGKEKFNLEGEQLVDFITKAVNAIESNPSRGENPYVVRRALAGRTNNAASIEAGKLAYQFFTFEHTWLENLALNIRSDFEQTYQTKGLKNKPAAIAKDLIKNKNAALNRTLIPLLLMGGVSGIPLFKFSKLMYTAITGDDPKKKFDKMFGKDTTLENTVLYGVTGQQGISEKMTPEAPILDRLEVGTGVLDTIGKNITNTNLPMIATTGQLAQGFKDLLTPKQRLRGLGEVGPRPIRDVFNAVRLKQEGAKLRSGKVMIPKGKITNSQVALQAFGVTPAKVISYSEEQKIKRLQAIHKKLIKAL